MPPIRSCHTSNKSNDQLSQTPGLTGAELTALCQEAALETMREDINAPFIPHAAFVRAAKRTKAQVTFEVLEKFRRWGERQNV